MAKTMFEKINKRHFGSKKIYGLKYMKYRLQMMNTVNKMPPLVGSKEINQPQNVYMITNLGTVYMGKDSPSVKDTLMIGFSLFIAFSLFVYMEPRVTLYT